MWLGEGTLASLASRTNFLLPSTGLNASTKHILARDTQDLAEHATGGQLRQQANV